MVHIGGWGGYHNREIVLPCLLACTHARTHAHSTVRSVWLCQFVRSVRLSVGSLLVSLAFWYFSCFLVYSTIFWGMSRGFRIVWFSWALGCPVCTCFLEQSWFSWWWLRPELWFCQCFYPFFKLSGVPIIFCTCFLECFQCSLLGLLRDCILHVFSPAFLQVCGWNTQTLHFPRVFSIQIDVVPRLILYVFCRVFRRFGLLLYDSACPLVRWFSFYWVFLSVFDSFYEHHLETLWMHVFNGCVKVFIFSSISGLVSCIARVFSSFLAAGWLAGYGWAGWLAARWLPGWWVWFSRDV